MKFWFFPCWSGDFRLEKDGEDACILTVEDPTEADKKLLTPFMKQGREKGWFDTMTGIQPKGLTTIPVPAPMSEVGPLLAVAVHGSSETWTAIRYEDGTFSVSDGVVHEPEVVVDEKPEDIQPKPVAAATIKQPRQGCPAPEACFRRASEVLQAFCTVSQWKQWVEEGRIRLFGHATGKAYYVYHRDQAAKQGLSHALVEAGTGKAICIWDDSVPAEEEVLGIKMAVEHRERWLLRMPRGAAAVHRAVDAKKGPKVNYGFIPDWA